jgi:hypothetical protein
MAKSNAATELGNFANLKTDELRRKWTALYSTPPGPRISRDLLVRGIAYRLQEKANGGRSKVLLRRLDGLAKELSAGSTMSLSQRPSFKAGTKLIREWKGQVHEVVITDKGYVWAGKHYRSLSKIARSITGTRWSGPRFFGLETGQQACEQPAAAPNNKEKRNSELARRSRAVPDGGARD